MAKTRIEWCNYSINPVKGLCPVDCKDNQGKSYCYARRMYKRFKWDETIRFQPGEFLCLPFKPSRVFIGSTMELFGDWVKPEWLGLIFDAVKVRPRHTFIFLTKNPIGLIPWSPFPDNCWVGVSVTNQAQYDNAMNYLGSIEAALIFISFEPLLSRVVVDRDAGQRWYIIGQQTPIKASTEPKVAWIQEILVAAHNAGNIPVFIKNNLHPLLKREWPSWPILQEYPK